MEVKKDVALVQMISIKGINKSKVFNNQEEIIKLIRKNNAQNEQENIEFLEFMSREFKKNVNKSQTIGFQQSILNFLLNLWVMMALFMKVYKLLILL